MEGVHAGVDDKHVYIFPCGVEEEGIEEGMEEKVEWSKGKYGRMKAR